MADLEKKFGKNYKAKVPECNMLKTLFDRWSCMFDALVNDDKYLTPKVYNATENAEGLNKSKNAQTADSCTVSPLYA